MEFDLVIEEEEVKAPSEGVRLLIVSCSSRDMKPQTSSSLLNLGMWLTGKGGDFGLTDIDVIGGVSESLLSNARQRRLDMALEGNYTHLACFDDDMIFPYDTVHRLIAHKRDVVFANVCQKTPGKISGVCLDSIEQKRIDSSGKTGLERVAYGTLACTLIRLDAIRQIPKPHFEVLWEPSLNNGKGGYQGEDHYFFRKMAMYGIEFYCDHDLTKEVSHVGDYPYKFIG